MSSAGKNLSDVAGIAINFNTRPLKIGIVQAVWNSEITGKLLQGAQDYLLEQGIQPSQITSVQVSGAMELPLAAQWLLEKTDAVIVLGCVIRGGTPHFEYVCQGTTQGVMQVQLHSRKPVIYGLLTVNTEQEAFDRAGGIHGNKGTEAAATLLHQMQLKQHIDQL